MRVLARLGGGREGGGRERERGGREGERERERESYRGYNNYPYRHSGHHGAAIVKPTSTPTATGATKCIECHYSSTANDGHHNDNPFQHKTHRNGNLDNNPP